MHRGWAGVCLGPPMVGAWLLPWEAGPGPSSPHLPRRPLPPGPKQAQAGPLPGGLPEASLPFTQPPPSLGSTHTWVLVSASLLTGR